jgi:hypothetical protein
MNEDHLLPENYGMTIRDVFAAAALVGLVVRPDTSVQEDADTAYRIAEAMLERRKV